VPERYSEALTVHSSSNSTLPAWEGFYTDDRLQSLIRIALANNRDLRVAMLRVDQARAQLQIRTADQYPELGLAANATRAPSAENGDLKNTFGLGAALSTWEIDFFGRIASLKDQALAQYLATEEGRMAAQASLMATVANTWLAVMVDHDLLSIAQKNVSSRENTLRLVRSRVNAGVSSALELRQAESSALAAKAAVAQLKRQVSGNTNALALLLGQQPFSDSIGIDTFASNSIFAPVPAALPSRLLEQRPDIRQAEQTLIAANANIGAARAAFFPRISLTAQAGTTSNELSDLFKSGSWGFSVAPSLLLPIFDAGRNQANLDSAVINRDIALAQYEKTIQVAFKEVADALAAEFSLQDQSKALHRQVEVESQRLDLAQLRYENGVSSFLEVLDAQRSVFASEQSATQVRLAQLQNRILLYQALGGGSWISGASSTPHLLAK
jgi:multidrug efflux system outer membrane protein